MVMCNKIMTVFSKKSRINYWFNPKFFARILTFFLLFCVLICYFFIDIREKISTIPLYTDMKNPGNFLDFVQFPGVGL